MTHRTTRAALAGFGALALAAALPAADPAPLPLDLAFSAKTIRRYEKPAVSRDGRILAYEVHTPPLLSPERSMGEGTRFLPTGAPPIVSGLKLFVVPTAGGEARAACPAKGNCWRPSPSDDGKLVAFYSDAGGMPQLWVYDVASGKSRRVSDVPIKAKHWAGDEAAWSADGREVFVPIRPADAEPIPAPPPAAPAGGAAPETLEKPTVAVFRTGGGPAPAPAGGAPPADVLAAHFRRENNATLAAIEIATGKMRIVVPSDAVPRPSCLRLSPDGKWMSYLSVFKRMPGEVAAVETKYDLAVAPAAGGAPRLLAENVHLSQRDYFEDTYRWIPGTTRIVYLNDKKLWLVDAAAPGPPRQLGASLGNLEEEPLLMTPDGKGVLVGQEVEGEKTYYFVAPRALALVPLDGSAPKTVATVGTVLRADRDTLWQPSPGRFAVATSDEATGERSIVSVDPSTGNAATLWKGRGRFDAAGAAAGGGIVARYEALDTPPDFYLFDAKFASKKRLTHAEPRLDGVALGPLEIVAAPVPGFDGRLQTVQTAVFLPPGKKAGDRLPTLVYFYAGSKMSDAAQEWGGGAPNSIPVAIFTTRGYAVLLVDVPLGPEGKPGNPIQEMGDAILAQVYRAADRGYTDVARVAIMGQSYGGYSTAAMTTQTNLFRAAMALDGLYDIAGDYATMGPGGFDGFFWAETGQGRMGNHPWGDLRRFLANSPYYQADKIHTPLLLIHGKKDDACPVQGAERMFNALKRLGRVAELAVYEGEGHVPGSWSQVNAVDATQRMVDFLGKHVLKTPGTAETQAKK